MALVIEILRPETFIVATKGKADQRFKTLPAANRAAGRYGEYDDPDFTYRTEDDYKAKIRKGSAEDVARGNPEPEIRRLTEHEQERAILNAEYDVRCCQEALREAQDRLEWARKGYAEPAPAAEIVAEVTTTTTETITAEELANPRRRGRRNPTPNYREAHWGLEAPQGIISATAGDPARGPLVAYGELVKVIYGTRKKGDRAMTNYVHAFRREKPVLAFNKEGKGKLIIVGGSYSCEARGIVG